ncbi:LacI family DNA-binding transcriptional regulator [Streptomyces chiangmaiensis]|uniref:LacI family DNA-binding transcriptional regulator n=1 Tax=Streptomyces chiangmaiensis TaxID=766497 RepID=A0ABU7FGT7_9ACTN|nr:LacI family DNA-binding transcriptional regulator [Streptomyces chiangmaiensis]MED7823058.1 LacI family DNA-binding transcriptional regulator [Streptomyces chiangmaiensis]
MSNRRVSLRWVAEQAGVSPATVSRVSRGSAQVSPELRDRVLRVIEESGYRPNHLGRALAEVRHGALGLVFPGLSGPYFTELLQGFEAEALETGDSVLLLASHYRADTDAKVIDLAGRVDGMAIHAGTVSDAVVEEVSQQVRVVMMCGTANRWNASVSTDNTTSGALTRHLLVEHGYRRLAFVGHPEGSPDVTSRWDAFLAAHHEVGVAPPVQPVRVGLQQSDGVIAAERILAEGTLPDAVVCANDETALGLMLCVLGRGLRVPDDLAVTGFDDMNMAAMVRPGLTTVRQPVRELATTTARLLTDPDTRPAGDLVLPTELVLRGSCGCRPGG